MKKHILMIVLGSLLLMLFACKQTKNISDFQEKIVFPIDNTIDTNSKIVKNIIFEGYQIALKSTKVNNDLDAVGFEWKAPNSNETKNGFSIDEVSERVFCYYKPYYYDTKSFVSSKMVESESRSAPTTLEFYSKSNDLLKTIDIYTENPYKPSKGLNIDKEFYYDSEVGFAHIEERQKVNNKKADHYWTSTSVYGTTEKYGFVVLDYTLTGLNKDDAILFQKSTLSVFDEKGNKIFTLKDIHDNPYGVLVTKDRKYTVINIGGNVNLNNMRERLSKNAIIFYDNNTEKEIYRETIEIDFDEFGIVGERNGLVTTAFTSAYEKKVNPDYQEDRFVYDMEKRICYYKKLTKQEYKQYLDYIKSCIEGNTYNRIKGDESIKFLITNFKFNTKKI